MNTPTNTPDPLSPEREDKYRELADQIKAEPWKRGGYSYTDARGVRRDIVTIERVAEWSAEEARYPEEILAAREAVPALLAELDRLRAERDEAFRCRNNALRALHRDDIDNEEPL